MNYEELSQAIAKAELRQRTDCAVCSHALGTPAIDLPGLPLSEVYVREKPDEPIGLIDQSFHLCERCGHGQVSTIVDPELLYGFGCYAFKTSRSSSSIAGNNYFHKFIQSVDSQTHFANIVEIGCNDVYLLKLLEDRGEHLVGIDPVLKTEEASVDDERIQLIPEFFEDVDLRTVLNPGSTLVVSSHNLEHVEDPRGMIATLFEYLSEDDLVILQFPGLETLLEDHRFDQIFHHHLHYFSLRSFEYLVSELGGELLAYDVNRRHWGSLLVAFRKSKDYELRHAADYAKDHTATAVQQKFTRFREALHQTCDYIRAYSGPTYGYGAALSLPILAHHMGSNLSELNGVIDDDPNKTGMYYLGLPSPIVHSTDVGSLRDVNIVLTAVNNARDILPKLFQLGPRNVIVPSFSC